MTEEQWQALARFADIIATVAAILALVGLFSTWLSRPRVRIDMQATGAPGFPGSAYISVSHVRGTLPIRNLELGAAAVDNGRAVSGEGTSSWVPELFPHQSRSINVFKPGVGAALPEGFGTVNYGFESGYNLLFEIGWQRTVLPWLRVRRIVSWTDEDRATGKPPVLLGRLRGPRVYDKAVRASMA